MGDLTAIYLSEKALLEAQMTKVLWLKDLYEDTIAKIQAIMKDVLAVEIFVEVWPLKILGINGGVIEMTITAM
jgi:hypothetical protein